MGHHAKGFHLLVYDMPDEDPAWSGEWRCDCCKCRREDNKKSVGEFEICEICFNDIIETVRKSVKESRYFGD